MHGHKQLGTAMMCDLLNSRIRIRRVEEESSGMYKWKMIVHMSTEGGREREREVNGQS